MGFVDHIPDDFKEDLPKVFTRFWRAAESADSPGTGLGLYLAREIITACGGYIKARSDFGKGSVFSVFLSNLAPPKFERGAHSNC
jgi:signal transduction histidine kinase